MAIRHLGIMAVALLLLLSACGEKTQPLRIGTTPWPGYEFLHLAETLGYFKEEGVTVQLVDFLSLADSSRAFERGQIDIWGTTLVELVLSHKHSQRHAQAFLVVNESAGGDVILAKTPIHSVTQLKDKRIGLEPSTVDVVLLHHALQQASLSAEQVRLVPLAQADLEDALQSGQVDAVSTYPPNSVHIARDTSINQIFDSSQIPNTIIDVLAGDRLIIEERSEEIAAISRAFFRARAFATQNPQQAFAMLTQGSQITEQELHDVLQGIRLTSAEEQSAYLQPSGRLGPAIDGSMQALVASGLPGPFGQTESMYTNRIITQLEQP